MSSTSSRKRRRREEAEDKNVHENSGSENISTDPDLLRILIATDNHLGYNEKDGICGDDSFRAWDEIFAIAKRRQVDMVLLGGDIFHDNNPSRATVLRCVQTLSKYCLGDDPVQFQIVSDQKANFPDSDIGLVNYMNPNVNIGLPVFCIHGNHDDPAGVGRHSAVEMLSYSNLVNYFGKSSVDRVTVSPVLIEKGATKLALYGMGHLRDERLNRMFTNKQVHWKLMKENPEQWFKMFVIHQNRVQHTKTQSNVISESLLPKWLDVVVWGHEHESKTDFEHNADREFDVYQPGSSVATSLCQGEVAEKHIGMLEIRRDDYRLETIPLTTVRPLVWRDYALYNSPDLDPSEYTDDDILAVLENGLEDMLAEEKKRAEPLIAQQIEQQCGMNPDEPTANIERRIRQQFLPLVRLRANVSGFRKVSTVRLSQAFQGRVANPNSIIAFYKRSAVRAAAAAAAAAGGGGGGDGTNELDEMMQSHIDNQNITADVIGSMITKRLGETEALSVLPEPLFRDAIREFVEKHERGAIAAYVDESIEWLSKTLSGSGITPSNVEEHVTNSARTRHNQLEEESGHVVAGAAGVAASGAGAAGAAGVLDSDDDDVKHADEDVVATKTNRGKRQSGKKSASKPKKTSRKKVASGTGRRSTRGKKNREPDSDDDEDYQEEEEESEDETMTTTRHSTRSSRSSTRSKKKAAVVSASASASASRSRSKRVSRTHANTISIDDSDDDAGADADMKEELGTNVHEDDDEDMDTIGLGLAPAVNVRSSRRNRTAAAVALDSDEDEDEEEEEEEEDMFTFKYSKTQSSAAATGPSQSRTRRSRRRR
jgi:double-strand break repair protein MRE11